MSADNYVDCSITSAILVKVAVEFLNHLFLGLGGVIGFHLYTVARYAYSRVLSFANRG